MGVAHRRVETFITCYTGNGETEVLPQQLLYTPNASGSYRLVFHCLPDLASVRIHEVPAQSEIHILAGFIEMEKIKHPVSLLWIRVDLQDQTRVSLYLAPNTGNCTHQLCGILFVYRVIVAIQNEGSAVFTPLKR